MTEFGKAFNEATDGAYEVQIYPNAIMGDQGPVTELVRTGTLQMAMVPVSVPEGYNAEFPSIRDYQYQHLYDYGAAGGSYLCLRETRSYVHHVFERQAFLKWSAPHEYYYRNPDSDIRCLYHGLRRRHRILLSLQHCRGYPVFKSTERRTVTCHLQLQQRLL